MTKQELRNYRQMKDELSDLDKLVKRLNDLKLPELTEVYDEKIESLKNRLKSIEDAFEGLEPVERRLMRLRYIDGLEWHQVAVRISYSWQQTHRIHARALIKLLNK